MKITEVAQIFWLRYSTVMARYQSWATVWATFSQTHLVALVGA
jgi:hypothetical protein